MQGIPNPRGSWGTNYNHSNECNKLMGISINIDDLDVILQDYVLLCPSPEHDAVRLYMGYEEKLDPVTRKLVRIHA